MAGGHSIKRGLHRLLLLVAAILGLASGWLVGERIWSADRWFADTMAASARKEAVAWEKRAKMWAPDDQSRHAREARAEADRLRQEVETAEPAPWNRALMLGAAAFAGSFGSVYLAGVILWLAGRWVWLGFRGSAEPS